MEMHTNTCLLPHTYLIAAIVERSLENHILGHQDSILMHLLHQVHVVNCLHSKFERCEYPEIKFAYKLVKHKVMKEARNICHAFHWPDSRMSSSCFVHTISLRQGLKNSCI